MTHISRQLGSLLLACIVFAMPGALAAQERSLVPVTIDGEQVRLATITYKPPGNGPFPTLIFHHGSTGRGRDPALFERRKGDTSNQGSSWKKAMNSPRLTMTPDVAFRLMDRLSKVKSVSQFDRPERPEAGTLAHSFADLEKSFREVLDVLLPKLLDESLSPEQMNDVLLDIGEEFRHILYHIKDPKFFGYLLDTDK